MPVGFSLLEERGNPLFSLITLQATAEILRCKLNFLLIRCAGHTDNQCFTGSNSARCALEHILLYALFKRRQVLGRIGNEIENTELACFFTGKSRCSQHEPPPGRVTAFLEYISRYLGRRNTNPCFRESELGVFHTNGDVAATGNTQPAGHSRPLNHGNSNLRQSVEVGEHVTNTTTHAHRCLGFTRCHRFEPLEVTTRAKETTFPANSHTADIALRGNCLDNRS